MRERAYRRHHRQRILNKWKKIGLRWGRGESWDDYFSGIRFFDQEIFDWWLYRSAENMPTCSKPWCCGNPRALGFKTWKEQRADADEKEQILELYKEDFDD